MSTPEQQAIIDYLKKNLTIELDREEYYESSYVDVEVYLKLEGEVISTDSVTIYNQK